MNARISVFAALLLVGLFSGMRANILWASELPLVKIPAGSIKPFWIDVLAKKDKRNTIDKKELKVAAFLAQPYQITHEEFSKFLIQNKEWQKEQVSPLFADEAYLVNFEPGGLLKKGVPPRSPVTNVSWFAAKAYCESVNMRLPTTDEWEYMAAASAKKRDASNDPEFIELILDWYGRPNGNQFRDVGHIFKNIYGLWDMHGLVWEWVEDFNSNLVTGESREDSSFNRDLFCGAGNLSGGNKENYAAFMRYAFRSSLQGKSAIWNLGFRCVRSL